MANNSKNKNEENETIQSFKMYPSSNDGETKTIDGEKCIESFRMYKAKDGETDFNND
ncbi:MAG: hypothetical protein PHY26_01750 [Bacilli bacterium]|jgi:hypothetical protein|nr:hypothetical protein [Bacilli bacterium]